MYKCEWCDHVFDTPKIIFEYGKIPVCPKCGDLGILEAIEDENESDGDEVKICEDQKNG